MSLIKKDDLLNVLKEIRKDKNLKTALSESLQAGLLTGSSAVTGGLLSGPVGLAIGGAIGGAASALSAKRKFKPVAGIIREMPPTQKESLLNAVKNAFKNITVTDVAQLVILIISAVKFLKGNFSMAIK